MFLRLISLAVFGENPKYCCSLGIVVVSCRAKKKKMTLCHISAITDQPSVGICMWCSCYIEYYGSQFENSYALTHYHAMLHFDTLKIYSC